MFINFSIAFLSCFHFILPYSLLGFDVAESEKVIEVFFVGKGVEALGFYLLDTIFG